MKTAGTEMIIRLKKRDKNGILVLIIFVKKAKQSNQIGLVKSIFLFMVSKKNSVSTHLCTNRTSTVPLVYIIRRFQYFNFWCLYHVTIFENFHNLKFKT